MSRARRGAVAGTFVRRSTLLSTLLPTLLSTLLSTLLWTLTSAPLAAQPAPVVTVRVDTSRVLRTIGPDPILGGAIDAHDTDLVAGIWGPTNLAAMRSVGLRQLSYRLRTELSVAAWHWNPRGRWSEAARRQGYWTSDETPGAPILASTGYDLPRRGNTFDQAGQREYSRLTDGDRASFWKSNPYLAARYTGESDSLHPQLIVVDLARAVPVNAVRLAWAAPFATHYVIERWVGNNTLPADAQPAGSWERFDAGEITRGRGGTVTHRLTRDPVPTRWLRIRLLVSSHTALPGSRDPRDSLGFAMRELFVGRLDRNGRFTDLVRHRPSQRQTATWTSSTDPWHRARDRSPDLEHPGIDRVFTSGLVEAKHVMLSVGALYDTPENGAALLRYVRRRGYGVTDIEIGEEPDGQYVSADDYGALHRQVGRALQAVDSTVHLAGPSLQSTQLDVRWWPDRPLADAWLARFARYLRQHGDASLLQAATFEWYPFDATCDRSDLQLARHRRVYDRALARLRPPIDSLPWMLTEVGYSAFAGTPEVSMAAALLFGDVLGRGLEQGLARAYVYRWEPASLQPAPRCGALGINALHLVDDDLVLRDSTAVLQAVRLLQREWLPAVGTRAQLLTTSASDSARIGAYTLRHDDGTLAMLLVHHDSTQAVTVQLEAIGTRETEVWSYGPAQYAWRAAPAPGRTVRNAPPSRERTRGPTITVPPYTMLVVRWRS